QSSRVEAFDDLQLKLQEVEKLAFVGFHRIAVKNRVGVFFQCHNGTFEADIIRGGGLSDTNTVSDIEFHNPSVEKFKCINDDVWEPLMRDRGPIVCATAQLLL